jgi:hypothetical protein
MDKAQLETLLTRIDIWLLVFGIIVVIGVAGESFWGIRHWWNSRKLQVIQQAEEQSREAKIAQLRKEAAEIGKDAAGAKERAAKAEEHLATAHKEAAEANAKAEGFRLDIAKANERAAKAELETARLTGALADRQLTDAQLGSIAGRLKVFKGQEYTVTAYWNSPESLGITNRIHVALQLAGWSYSPEGSKSRLLGGIIGILVSSHPDADKRTKEAVEALVAALVQEGIQAEAEVDTNIWNSTNHNGISLTVGSKR